MSAEKNKKTKKQKNKKTKKQKNKKTKKQKNKKTKKKRKKNFSILPESPADKLKSADLTFFISDGTSLVRTYNTTIRTYIIFIR